MRKRAPYWIVLGLCALALVASSMLLVDYVRPAPVFCDGGGGCAAIKQTAYARPFGVPLPLIGIGGLLGIAMAQSIAGRRARIAQAMLAVFGGIVATGLLVVQALMGKLCPYCFVTDTASIAIAGLSLARALKGWDPPEPRRELFAGVAVLMVSVLAPTTFGMTRRVVPADVPPVIAQEIQKTGHGKVTIVDFVDFECPFCRMTHAELAPLVAARKDKIRLVRKHVPLRMHPHALDAAKTACCAEAQGKGEEVAEALFTAPPETLTSEGCEKIAEKHGLDLAKFRACVASPVTEARIHADGETFRAANGHGLPTIFIDGTRLDGAQDKESLESALDGAMRSL